MAPLLANTICVCSGLDVVCFVLLLFWFSCCEYDMLFDVVVLLLVDLVLVVCCFTYCYRSDRLSAVFFSEPVCFLKL